MSELDPGFVSSAMRTLFAPTARVRNMLLFEAALARVQGRLGLIASDSSDAIVKACSELKLNPDAGALLQRGWELGTPAVALLEQLGAAVSPAHAAYVHHGATTQDAVDTASAMELHAGLGQLNHELTLIARALCALARQHRDTPYCARTVLQRAQPTVFGLIVAHWLLPLVTASAELERAQDALPVQLGGPIGTLDNLELVKQLAQQLGLRAPLASWHGDRTPIMQAVQAACLSTRAVLKIANDLLLLSQSDVCEVRMRAGGSSSMAHKQNAIDAVRAVAASEASLRLAAALVAGRPHELERAAGGWQLEWLLVPLVFYSSGAAHEALHAALTSLTVDTARMRASAAVVGGEPDPTSAHRLIDRALAAAAARWGSES